MSFECHIRINAVKAYNRFKNASIGSHHMHVSWCVLGTAVYKAWTGTLGRVCGDAGTSNIGDAGGKVGGKCAISFFVKMCYLWSTLTAFDSK